MSKKWVRAVVIIGSLCADSGTLWAHHSVAAGFDMSRRISVTGTLTKVDWINPHVSIAVDGTSEDGKPQHWTFESNPPSWYRSCGLARTDLARAIGQTVTVEGVRAKNDSAFGFVQKLKMADGTTLNLFTAPGRNKQ